MVLTILGIIVLNSAKFQSAKKKVKLSAADKINEYNHGDT